MPHIFAMKHKRYLNTLFTFLGFVIIGWLSFAHPDWLLLDAIFTYIFGYLLLLICLTPAGNIRFGSQNTSTWLSWFSKLMKGQLALFVLSLCAYIAFFYKGPAFATGGLDLAFAYDTVAGFTKWQWGIFPWGLYGLWGIVIAYVVYLKKGEPFFYQLARGFTAKSFEPTVKTFVEGSVSGASIMAISLAACAIILILTYGIDLIFNVNHFALPILTFMVVSFFTPIISFKWGRKLFNAMTIRKNAYFTLYFFMIISMVIVLIICGFVVSWFIRTYPEIYKLQCQQCGNYFANVPQEIRFAAVYWGWWVIWAPLAGSYLASISKGRTLREVILGLFLLPAVLLLIIAKWGLVPFTNLFAWLQQLALFALSGFSFVNHEAYLKAGLSLQFIVLGLITWFILVNTLKDFKDTQVFHSGFMAPSANAKTGRLWLKDATKYQGVSKLAQKLALAIVGTIFIHALSGWYGIQLEVAAMGILLINVAYTGFHFIIWRFYKDRVWLGNQNIPPY
ncbi:MAG: BCCT family transporter [Proteobacteria bacterium]|nr:BCCT family transporter [Pseudomonadota bacterium]